jgi:hypothetical protein
MAGIKGAFALDAPSNTIWYDSAIDALDTRCTHRICDSRCNQYVPTGDEPVLAWSSSEDHRGAC